MSLQTRIKDAIKREFESFVKEGKAKYAKEADKYRSSPSQYFSVKSGDKFKIFYVDGNLVIVNNGFMIELNYKQIIEAIKKYKDSGSVDGDLTSYLIEKDGE